jgi:hypothetical protein
MHSTICRSALAALVCAIAVAAATPSVAEMVNLKATLSSKSEVPPNDSAATGSVAATYDTASKKLSWKGSYSGLSGNATAAHFHGSTPPSPPAANSAVVLPITASASPFEGSATLNDAQAADLLAGKLYVNVHTAKNPGGEIRGQVSK